MSEETYKTPLSSSSDPLRVRRGKAEAGLSEGGRRQIQNAIEAARETLNRKKPECLVEDPVRSHSGVLDTDRCTAESIAYATAVLNAWVTELWPIWTQHGGIRKRLNLIIQAVQIDVAKQWQLDEADRVLFETVCLPEVTKALASEGDIWELRGIVLKSTPKPQAPDEHVSDEPIGKKDYGEDSYLTDVPRASERGAGNVFDAAYARDNPAPLLRPVKSSRLIAMANLRDDAREAIQRTAPKTPQEAEQCLRPAHSKYARELYDRSAEDKLQAKSGSRPRAFGRWLRSKCLEAVVEDVCGVGGQFTMTVRHVADFIGDRYPRETFQALWGILARDLDPDSFRDQLRASLSTELDGRSHYWEGQSRLSAKTAKPVTAENTGLAYSDDWDSLRSGFMQLRVGCAINPPLNPAGRLTAIWTAIPEPGNWRLSFWEATDRSGFKERFTWHASEAAALLGHQGDDGDALSYWLDQVRRHAPKQYPRRIVEAGGTDGEDRLYSIEILDICGLSAEFCRKCKADAIRNRAKPEETLKPRAGSRAPGAEEGMSEPERTAVEQTATRPGSDKREYKKAASWGAIEISFLSDERVEIRIGTSPETWNYGELGFADRRAKRGKPKPNQAWVILRAMAQQNGIIRDGLKTGAAWPKVEKRMQEIRKVLRKHFGIAADPIPFVEGTGYQACFKICCSPSFHT